MPVEVLDPWLSVLRVRSKAWLAAPGLLAHAEVTKIIVFQWVQNLGTPLCMFAASMASTPQSAPAELPIALLDLECKPGLVVYLIELRYRITCVVFLTEVRLSASLSLWRPWCASQPMTSPRSALGSQAGTAANEFSC